MAKCTIEFDHSIRDLVLDYVHCTGRVVALKIDQDGMQWFLCISKMRGGLWVPAAGLTSCTEEQGG